MSEFLLWVIAIVLVVSAWRLRRRTEKSDERWSQLTQRVHTLEQQLLKFVKLESRLAELGQELKQMVKNFQYDELQDLLERIPAP